MFGHVHGMFRDVSPAIPAFTENWKNTILKFGSSYSAMQTGLVYDVSGGKVFGKYHLHHHGNGSGKKILVHFQWDLRW